jgi:hypothetical protein
VFPLKKHNNLLIFKVLVVAIAAVVTALAVQCWWSVTRCHKAAAVVAI